MNTTNKDEPTQAGSIFFWYALKPLTWEAAADEFMESHRARVPMGIYRVERYRDDIDERWQNWKYSYCFDEYYDEYEGPADSLEEGKKQAWEDWQKRILPALERVDHTTEVNHRANGDKS